MLLLRALSRGQSTAGRGHKPGRKPFLSAVSAFILINQHTFLMSFGALVLSCMHVRRRLTFAHLPVHAVQAKRIMHTELPPRSFWWWCCGGLKVYDALIVTGYLIVNVLYVEQRYELYMAGLKRALPSPPCAAKHLLCLLRPPTHSTAISHCFMLWASPNSGSGEAPWGARGVELSADRAGHVSACCFLPP